MSDKLNEIPISEIIGNTIAELRKSTGMTQREFSKTVGVSESSIAHYEQGITVPSADMLLKYANYFDVNIDYLFGRCRCKVKYSDLNSVLADHMLFLSYRASKRIIYMKQLYCLKMKKINIE